MRARKIRTFFAVPVLMLAGATVVGPLGTLCQAQTTVKRPQPGFNLFTVDQDVEIGRQSAIEAEKQIPLLNDAATNRYLNQIVQRLAAQAPGARYPYTIKAVNAAEINAFSLPGGPMYVNRGLITAARNEAELAGVLAHEMSHVALRHGTNQASKAYLAQSGLGLLGGLLGKGGGNASQIVNAVGGLGLNAAFLKFSRDDEYQADALGADIMSKAGYDPNAMANFFALLRQEQGRDPSKLERFFSDHPPAADRESRIRSLASRLGPVSTQEVGGFATIRSRLGGSTLATSQTQTQWPQQNTATGEVALPPGAQVRVSVVPPSARFTRFAQPTGFFTIDYPDNWRAYPSGFAVSIAPGGGVVGLPNGQQSMLYGVIVNHYAPFEGEYSRQYNSLRHHYAPFEDRSSSAVRGTLEDATDDLVRQVLSTNSYLSAADGSARAQQIDGAPAYSVLLSGLSPVTGEQERVIVFTRGLPDGHVIYALCIVPANDYASVSRTFTRMMQSLRVNDEAAHRTTQNTPGTGIKPPN